MTSIKYQFATFQIPLTTSSRTLPTKLAFSHVLLLSTTPDSQCVSHNECHLVWGQVCLERCSSHLLPCQMQCHAYHSSLWHQWIPTWSGHLVWLFQVWFQAWCKVWGHQECHICKSKWWVGFQFRCSCPLGRQFMGQSLIDPIWMRYNICRSLELHHMWTQPFYHRTII